MGGRWWTKTSEQVNDAFTDIVDGVEQHVQRVPDLALLNSFLNRRTFAMQAEAAHGREDDEVEVDAEDTYAEHVHVFSDAENSDECALD
eukprot:401079-Karenia_brevis.AAC.1